MKLGGDKGGSSFKTSFQIVNVDHPNLVHNTCVFTAFQAPDTVFNLQVALDRYVQQVDDLQKSQWRLNNFLKLLCDQTLFHNRGKNLRIFISGD